MTAAFPTRITGSCAAPECPRDIYCDGLEVCHDHIEWQLGITYRQLDHWTRKGFLSPVQAVSTSGVSREWPVTELEVARRMGRLTAAGLSVERAAAFARDGWPRAEIAPGIVIEVAS